MTDIRERLRLHAPPRHRPLSYHLQLTDMLAAEGPLPVTSILVDNFGDKLQTGPQVRFLCHENFPATRAEFEVTRSEATTRA